VCFAPFDKPLFLGDGLLQLVQQLRVDGHPRRVMMSAATVESTLTRSRATWSRAAASAIIPPISIRKVPAAAQRWNAP
jgi:hypothetical protein